MVCCKVCKSRNTKHIGSKNNCLIHRCFDCSLVFVDPLPSDEELDFFYNNYHKSDPVSYTHLTLPTICSV